MDDDKALPADLVQEFITGDGAFLGENGNIALVNPDASIALLLDTINDLNHHGLKFNKMDLLEMLPERSIINKSAFSLPDPDDQRAKDCKHIGD